jgi:hypothetical protein
VSIYSERFSLPGWGETTGDYDKNKYQFEIQIRVESKTDKETYLNQFQEIVQKISDKHNVDASVVPTEEFYNVNVVTFFTGEEGVFEKE